LLRSSRPASRDLHFGDALSRVYVTDDYVVTHNTALALNIGEHVASQQDARRRVFDGNGATHRRCA
jgi:hypothetical protein